MELTPHLSFPPSSPASSGSLASPPPSLSLSLSSRALLPWDCVSFAFIPLSPDSSSCSVALIMSRSIDPEQQPLLQSSGGGGGGDDLAKPSFGVGSRTSRAIANAEAEEGPFPSPLKTMLLAEAFGTCLFVQLGGAAQCCAAALSFGMHSSSKGSSSSSSSSSSTFPVAFVWGLALALSVYLTAAQSGAHLNPAVSLSFALVRPSDFRFRKLVPYFMVQLLAGALAALINLFLFHEAISSYENKSRIVRGSMQSTESAAALANYYRCVQLKSKEAASSSPLYVKGLLTHPLPNVCFLAGSAFFLCLARARSAALGPTPSSTISRTRCSWKGSGRRSWCSARSA
jgi:Major intrinsic protein